MAKRGVKSIYSDAQWAWVTDRFVEGYTITELADFLGMSKDTIHNRVCGKRPRKVLPPLKYMADEFNLLGNFGRDEE